MSTTKMSRRDFFRRFRGGRSRPEVEPARGSAGGFDLARFYRQRQRLGLVSEPPPEFPIAPSIPARPTRVGCPDEGES